MACHASDLMMDQTLKSMYLSWLGLHVLLSVAWSFGVQLLVFFYLDFSVVLFGTLGVSRCYNTLFL